ncbi:hypothetical protein PSH54_14905 [Pseudoalteromonas sp. Angola-30]|uniref:hypothetical protein n=1 Tax=Pseudoalteromonas sp. Angola-30 TaxID=3025341 RepID=UPI0023587FD4|nr:hypothetical protein [Pseudoalteromonas sp. Angola-30]MDC9526766.1 hypothetical protein [Pseudoalteromonas sp. Angola-30]
MKLVLCYLPIVIASFIASTTHTSAGQVYHENSDFVVIEAENFLTQHLDDKRRWLVFSKNTPAHNFVDADQAHYHDASNGSYIEILPDTRSNHHEALVRNENFTNDAGTMAVLSYPVYFETPGRYYAWARAYSTGSEDNGVHLGINGQWPESAKRLQLCEGKHAWTWSSAQRVNTNHCGTPNTIFVDIPHKGVHTIMVSMREDGFELDKLLLTKDKDYIPAGKDKAETLSNPKPLQEKTQLLEITDYTRILYAVDDFKIENTGEIPYYLHKAESALAINAVITAYRNKFAHAEYTVQAKEAGNYTLRLVTLAEIDGESIYIVSINNKEIGRFRNPEITTDYQEIYFNMQDVELTKGDIIRISSKAVTNGKIPENGGTAFARGRWRALVFSRND